MTINGKKLMKSEENLLTKLSTKYGVDINPTAGGKIANPYSGVARELCPLAYSLAVWIIDSYRSGRVRGSCGPWGDIPTADWDRARYLFLKLWPDEYYDLID